MGLAGGKWDAGDVVTQDRANQKMLLIDTGANIAAFASPQQGMRAYSTVSGSGLVAGEHYYYDGGWLQEDVDPDIEVYPHSTTIGDYTAPTAVTVSGFSSTAVNMDTNGSGGNLDVNEIYTTRRAGERLTSHSLEGKFLTVFNPNLIKNGSPTFNIVARLRRTSDGGIIATSTNVIAASGLPVTIGANQTFNFDGALFPAEDVRLTVETELGTGGDTSNNVHWVLDTETSAADRRSMFDGTSWTDTSTERRRGAYTHSINPPALAKDNDTTTKATTLSAVGSWLRAEMSATADKEPSAIALWPGTMTATQLKIQVSPDGAAWTDKRLINVASLVAGQYNYIRFNRDIAQMRYIRILAADAGAVTVSITEIKFLAPTESQWNRRHGHKKVLATEASIALAG